MIFAWMFLILMMVLNLASNWLVWGNDPVMQGFFQFLTLVAVGVVAFGLGMGYRAERDDDYPHPTRRK